MRTSSLLALLAKPGIAPPTESKGPSLVTARLFSLPTSSSALPFLMDWWIFSPASFISLMLSAFLKSAVTVVLASTKVWLRDGITFLSEAIKKSPEPNGALLIISALVLLKANTSAEVTPLNSCGTLPSKVISGLVVAVRPVKSSASFSRVSRAGSAL